MQASGDDSPRHMLEVLETGQDRASNSLIGFCPIAVQPRHSACFQFGENGIL